jgi:hypothetical protein
MTNRNRQRSLTDVSFRGDIVAKVFLGWRTKFPRTADAFRIRRCEGPHLFLRKRPRTVASAMQSVAALSRNLLSRDFWRRSIFDFCNNIGGNTDIPFQGRQDRFDPTRTWQNRPQMIARVRVKGRSFAARRCRKLRLWCEPPAPAPARCFWAFRAPGRSGWGGRRAADRCGPSGICGRFP